MASAVISKLFPAHYPVHLLHNTTISEVAIPHQVIVVLFAGTPISAVLETLSRASILSAPVFDGKGKVIGFVDVLDIVALFEDIKRQGKDIKTFFSTPVEKAMELPLVLEIPVLQGVPRHPMIRLSHTTTMAELFERIARDSLPRVAMVKDDKVIAVITQRDVLRWIYKNIKAFEHESLIFNVSKTMAQLGFGGPSDRKAVTITEGTFTAEAFTRMRNLNVSCLPVVNDQGRIVHVLSASDLRSLNAENVDLLDLPVHFFLTKRPPTPLVTATLDHNFSEVLRRLDASKKHRVVITDCDLKPELVVSLSDIIPLFALMAQK